MDKFMFVCLCGHQRDTDWRWSWVWRVALGSWSHCCWMQALLDAQGAPTTRWEFPKPSPCPLVWETWPKSPVFPVPALNFQGRVQDGEKDWKISGNFWGWGSIRFWGFLVFHPQKSPKTFRGYFGDGVDIILSFLGFFGVLSQKNPPKNFGDRNHTNLGNFWGFISSFQNICVVEA